MAKIEFEGLERIIQAFRDKAAKARLDEHPSVIVGYVASYALYVHENLEARHYPPYGTGGKAHFLIDPFRKLEGDGTIKQLFVSAVRAGKTPSQALVFAGMRVQRDSMEECPVDTGNMKAGAFTQLESQ